MATQCKEAFTFFWQNSNPFSQWHFAKFTGKCLFDNSTHTFENCEQWMMFNKAKLFKDEKTAEQILTASTPKMCKSLGREVKNFNETLWDQHKEQIVYEGNKLKFLQNEHLLQQLLETQGTTLVEASPFDRIWGIGLSQSDPRAQSRSSWRGSNLLGNILTRLRDDLMEK